MKQEVEKRQGPFALPHSRDANRTLVLWKMLTASYCRILRSTLGSGSPESTVGRRRSDSGTRPAAGLFATLAPLHLPIALLEVKNACISPRLGC